MNKILDVGVCSIAIGTSDWLDWKNTGKGRLRSKVRCLECCSEKLIHLAVATLRILNRETSCLGFHSGKIKR